MRKITPVLLLVLSFTAIAQDNADKDCLVPRVAFDVGSSKTSVKVAIVDKCLQKVARRFEPKTEKAWQRKVSYKESLDQTKALGNDEKLRFPEAIRAQGLKAFKELKGEADSVLSGLENVDLKKTQYVAVATAAFRTAAAADKELGRTFLADFFSEIGRETGLKVRILSQQEEGELGFLAASARAPEGVSLDKLVVWDIGGSSQQITTYQDKKFEVYQGQKLASVSMKQIIIDELFSEEERSARGKTDRGIKSPNPIGLETSAKAVEVAKGVARKEVPRSIQERIQAGGYVMGIGGVHGISIAKTTFASKTNEITASMLTNALTVRADLNDEAVVLLNSPEVATIEDAAARKKAMDDAKLFVETDVSNLALVLGYMEGLGIQKVHATSIDLADGALLDERLWK